MELKMRQERGKRGWTQEEVAHKLGVTKQAVQRIEAGNSKPSYDVLVKLEDLFHMSHRKLFAVVDDENQSLSKE